MSSTDSEQMVDATSPGQSQPQLTNETPAAGQGTLARHLRSLARQRGGYAVLVALIVAFTIAKPSVFASVGNVRAIIELCAIPALFALAVTVVLISGEFDLSFTNTASVAAVIVAYLMANSGVAWPVAVLIGLLVGVAAGGLNALVVVYQQVQSFIGTLAMGSVLLGIETAIGNNGEIAQGIPSGFLDIASKKPLLGLSVTVWIVVVLSLVAVVVVRFSLLGHQWSAIGGNRDAAVFSGIPVRRRLAAAFIVCAALSAVAGVLVIATSSAYFANSTSGYLLSSYTGAFVGLAFNKKNRFTVGGSLLGVLLIVVLQDGLTITNQPVWATSLFNGIVLIVAVRLTFGRRLRA